MIISIIGINYSSISIWGTLVVSVIIYWWMSSCLIKLEYLTAQRKEFNNSVSYKCSYIPPYN